MVTNQSDVSMQSLRWDEERDESSPCRPVRSVQIGYSTCSSLVLALIGECLSLTLFHQSSCIAFRFYFFAFIPSLHLHNEPRCLPWCSFLSSKPLDNVQNRDRRNGTVLKHFFCSSHVSQWKKWYSSHVSNREYLLVLCVSHEWNVWLICSLILFARIYWE